MRNFPDLYIRQPESLQYGQVQGCQLPLLLVRLVAGLDEIIHHQSAVLPLDDEVGIESYREVCVGNFGNILDINSNGDGNWLIWGKLELGK